MKKSNWLVILMTASLALSFALPVQADQPNMQAAKVDLNNALKSLRKATADKGGHRERAIGLVSQAITAVNKGIEYDRTHNAPGRRNSNFDDHSLRPVSIMPDQPNMMAARSFLNEALASLNRASSDKGGYREQARDFVRQAISEVNAGIEYDRRH